MKNIYVSVMITNYSKYYRRHDCYLYEYADGKETMRKLDYHHACKLMWELVLAGGTRTYRANMFDPSIADVEVNYFTRS